MAYPAVMSLERTIYRILHSSFSISLAVSPSQEILHSALKMVRSLRYFLEESERERTINHFERRISGESEGEKALGGEMREAAWELEDVLESRVLQSDTRDLSQVFYCFSESVKQMMQKMEDFDYPLPPQDDEAAVSLITSFGGNVSEIVGFTDIFRKIRSALVPYSSGFRTLLIVGMAGSGKTTLAKRLFEDPLIKDKFERCIFVPTCRKSRSKKIVQAIITHVNPDIDRMLLEEEDEGEESDKRLYECLMNSLNGRKYLIMLDDLWDHRSLHKLQLGLENLSNGTIILVTTRLRRRNVAFYKADTFDLRFMNEEESWDLLRRKVFGEKVCPPQLEKAGRKIAENCEGLPLLVVTVADLLSIADKTLELWNKVASNKQNSIFEEAYDQILEVLYPSYNFLTQELKACFLYMSVFPQNYEIRLSRLHKLLSTEEFLDIYKDGYPESFVTDSSSKLVSDNVALVVRKDNRNKIKVCSLHSVFWHLSRKEAGINKFHHTLNRYDDRFAENLESQRRLSIYKNVLFGIKAVYNSLASVSNARSLLCTGAYHQYQVPICFGSLRLLRVLDALTIRFYEFPVEVWNLDRLRYLSLTSNENLPPSISKLWNLQCLIVNQHRRIKLTLAESYLPVEIWYLRKLKYLKIMGRNLPIPPPGVVLSNLLKLFGVGVHSCTKNVLKSIPNLEKLRIHIELTPDAAEPLSRFDQYSRSSSLYSLQLFVVNPKLTSQIVAPLPSLSVFSRNLNELTLSGFGYPWKDIKEIAELSNLCVLKLQCYAFRGDIWELESGFLWLDDLTIEDTDLVHWRIGSKTFRSLESLILKNCYKLQDIPYISTLKEIQLSDCNPRAVRCAMRMASSTCKVSVHSSWEDGNLKS